MIKIAYIDDSFADLDFAKTLAESYDNIELIAIRPERKLFEQSAEINFDILLVDIHMGALTAFDVIKHIKGKPIYLISGIERSYLEEYRDIFNNVVDCISKGELKEFYDRVSANRC